MALQLQLLGCLRVPRLQHEPGAAGGHLLGHVFVGVSWGSSGRVRLFQDTSQSGLKLWEPRGGLRRLATPAGPETVQLQPVVRPAAPFARSLRRIGRSLLCHFDQATAARSPRPPASTARSPCLAPASPSSSHAPGTVPFAGGDLWKGSAAAAGGGRCARGPGEGRERCTTRCAALPHAPTAAPSQPRGRAHPASRCPPPPTLAPQPQRSLAAAAARSAAAAAAVGAAAASPARWRRSRPRSSPAGRASAGERAARGRRLRGPAAVRLRQ